MGVRAIRFIVTLVLLAPVSVSAGDGQTLYRQVATMSGESIPYAVHLPPAYDAEASYPVLIGPGDGEDGAEAGFYWRTEPHIDGWIIVDGPLSFIHVLQVFMLIQRIGGNELCIVAVNQLYGDCMTYFLTDRLAQAIDTV
ncbi:MAG: hypothetical protein IH926_09105, partial [Proteobacteria bacterium]|nr:hypothetical protein [Pseudomonadota bacterium]